MPADRLAIRLLGDFQVVSGDKVVLDERFRRRKALAVIKLLALQPAAVVARDQLLEQLWPDIAPEAAANNLHKAVYYLRSACEDAGVEPPVELAGGVVRLAPCEIDVSAFREAAEHASVARIHADLYNAALRLYLGDLLPADLYETWTERPREDLAQLHAQLAIELARIHEIRGDWRLVLDTLAPLEHHSTREEVQRAVMRAHAMCGDRDAAMRVYQRCERALREELDVAPSEQTCALRDDILHGTQPATVRAGRFPEADLIGRGPEMRRLLAALDESSRGAGGVVLLAGEPGIGKTRLAEELAFHAQVRDLSVLWARCEASEATPAYWPWIELLRQTTDARDGGNAAEIAALVPGSRASGSILKAPDRGRFRLHDAIASFLRNASRERPMLIVLDDLHDADIASLQLLLHVARQARDARLLILCTFRDVDLTAEHALHELLGDLVREHLKAQISLRGLDPDEVAQFVRNTSGVTPTDQLAMQLYRDTEGNPFFVKECALMLDAKAPSLGDARVELPASVREAVSRRIRSLSPATRQVIASASVIGQAFELPLLRRVSPSDGLLDALDEGVRRHIFRRDAGDPQAYAFCHGLIRQTVYEEMPASERARTHNAVGEALESSGEATRQLARLAYHFYEAAQGGGDANRAIDYARRAGDADIAVFAWESARRHWEMARALLEDRGDREQLADILERLPPLVFSTGQDLERGVRYLERAVTLRDALGQHEHAAEDHSRLGIVLSTHFGDAARYAAVTDLNRALDHYRAAEPVLGHGPDRTPKALFYVGVATVSFVGVHITEGLAASERAMEVAERLGMQGALGTASLLRGGMLKLAGRLRESADLFERAWEVGDAANDTAVTFYAATNRADWTEGHLAGRGDLLETELSRPRNAAPSAQRTTLIDDIACALVRNGRLDDARQRAAAAPDSDMMRAWLDFYSGRWDGVEEAFADGLDLLRQVGNRSAVANRVDHIATLRLAQGDLAGAQAALNEELAIGSEGALLIEMRARADLALIAAHTGRVDEAEAHLVRCREILANGEDWGRKAGRAFIAEAVLATLRGDAKSAERCLAAAVAQFAERALPWDEADAHVQLAHALDRCGEHDPANTQRDLARTIYRRINAAPAWLARTIA